MALRFLHTSDIHLLDLAGVRPWRFLNKRLAGGLNLLLRRRNAHDPRLFDEMMRRCEPLRIDRVVLTGDLTNLSLEPEFELVRTKLSALPVPATVIPGNHDAYTKSSERLRRFDAYMHAFMDGDRLDDAPYPFVQRLDDVALIGVSTAIATLPLYATGRVGDDQLRRLRAILASTRAERRARVILIHHPPVAGASKPRHDMLDIEAFGAIVREEGAELILHGHEHHRLESTLPGPDGPIPVHGIGSGTIVGRRRGHGASFSVYDASFAMIRREVYEWNGSEFAKASA